MAVSFVAKPMIFVIGKLTQTHPRLAFGLYRDHLSYSELSGPTYVGILKRLGLSHCGKIKEEQCLQTGFLYCGTLFSSEAIRSMISLKREVEAMCRHLASR